jgi:hypothetical protein
MKRTSNYSRDRDSQENLNVNEKYAETGESEFSRERTVPCDENEVLSERHYTFGPLEQHGKRRVRAREPRTGPRGPESNWSGKGPKGYRRSDETIKDDASDALYRSTAVDATDIEVAVVEGVVTLRGFVDSREQKRMAESAVDRLAGVKDVFNELRIRGAASGPSPRGLVDNITGLN